jgi:DNA-binding NarL/FixJ family response regulator
MDGYPPTCRVCTGAPSVVVVAAYPTLRRLIVELLERDQACWQVGAVAHQPELAAAVAAQQPDLVILDAADFPRCCRDSLHFFDRQHVIVVGPEPDAAYERAARRAGAGGWLPRDRVGEDLTACMRRVLGCTHRLAAIPPSDRLQTCGHNPKERR